MGCHGSMRRSADSTTLTWTLYELKCPAISGTWLPMTPSSTWFATCHVFFFFIKKNHNLIKFLTCYFDLPQGFKPRSPISTLADTVRWIHDNRNRLNHPRRPIPVSNPSTSSTKLTTPIPSSYNPKYLPSTNSEELSIISTDSLPAPQSPSSPSPISSVPTFGDTSFCGILVLRECKLPSKTVAGPNLVWHGAESKHHFFGLEVITDSQSYPGILLSLSDSLSSFSAQTRQTANQKVIVTIAKLLELRYSHSVCSAVKRRFGKVSCLLCLVRVMSLPGKLSRRLCTFAVVTMSILQGRKLSSLCHCTANQ